MEQVAEISGSGSHSFPDKAIDDGNTFQIRPTLENSFQTFQVKEIIKACLARILTDKTYSKDDVASWTKQIAQDVGNQIIELKMKRYKHVVQVALGQQLGAGCKYIARCRWDAECDSQVSDVFTNTSLYCIVTVFGVYLY
ncbi:dynein light chain Tctex-type protein 2B-like [Phlebotomus argentipes]|uniref:dynein light chain Tctex-type protein 2B-like n=1 Tax=Phlebotomus argentipes TaxID=94469 RepID=UPI002892AFC0|nr:dynein light chain Tctex-type protein 2B-like [Phlebotomus argentipes]